jgi:ribose transport system substrate-binding protein
MTQVSAARIVFLQQSGVNSSIERINGFSHAITGHRDFEIVATKEYTGEESSALSAMEEVIRSGVQFDAVFATNDAGAFGTYASLEKMGYSLPVNIMGVNGSPDGKDMIKKKQMIATAAQFPTDMGKKAAESMYALLRGETCEKEIYIPVKLITKYTIDSYDTDKWQ